MKYPQETYKEKNLQGFDQLRFCHERTLTVSPMDIKMELKNYEILNASSCYGKPTRFVALDCEYDADVETNLKMPCKVSIVNQEGHIILDTLINQRGLSGEVKHLKREVWLHGVETATLEQAPSFSEVKEHIFSVLDKSTTVIIGHSVKQDLLVMELTGYHFIDTSIIHNPRCPMNLRESVDRFLNGRIQVEGETHSSVIDARSSLALF